MIKYNNVRYVNWIHLLYDKLKKRERIDPRIFPTHDLYYCRKALENKFKRKFPFMEVKRLIATLPLKQSDNTQKDSFGGN